MQQSPIDDDSLYRWIIESDGVSDAFFAGIDRAFAEMAMRRSVATSDDGFAHVTRDWFGRLVSIDLDDKHAVVASRGQVARSLLAALVKSFDAAEGARSMEDDAPAKLVHACLKANSPDKSVEVEISGIGRPLGVVLRGNNLDRSSGAAAQVEHIVKALEQAAQRFRQSLDRDEHS